MTVVMATRAGFSEAKRGTGGLTHKLALPLMAAPSRALRLFLFGALAGPSYFFFRCVEYALHVLAAEDSIA